MSSPFAALNITARPDFGAYQKDHPTCQQVIDREQLTGRLADKVVLITGASSGIGVETARALYHTGAHLFLPVRDMAKGHKVKTDIESDGLGGKGVIELLQLDLESLDSVRKCAAAFLSKSKQLNILICNAGVMAVPEGQKTKDGLDMQFGVNHIAHFLLFQLLRDTLLSSSTPSFNSRVVTVSSTGHRFSPIHFDDLGMDKQPFNTWAAYGQSKTANAYMALELDRRYGSRGLHANVLHPGTMMTDLARHIDEAAVTALLSPELVKSMKTVDQGAATTVWAAVSREWEGKGGKYLEDVGVGELSDNPDITAKGYVAHLVDVDAAKRLWTESLRIVGVADDGTDK